MDIEKTIRDAIKRDRVTAYQLAKLMKGEVKERTIQRFIAGKSITLESAGILLDHYGYTLKRKADAK